MRRLVLLLPAVLALAVAMLSASCSDDGVTAAEVLQSDAPRAVASTGDADTAASALQLFAVDLFEVLARDEGNVVFSPYSAAIALAMTRAGATGETLEQMSAVLHADAARDLDAGLNAIDQALTKRPGEYAWGDKKVTLELATANQLWGQREFPFEAAYLDVLARQYGAGLRLLDFIEATEEARTKINTWVAERTRDRIPELIPQGVLTPDTRLVLTNAIYLNAPWRYRFYADATAPGPFTRLDGSQVQAQMMRLAEELRHAKGAGYEAVELPYVDGSLAMLVIVPEGGRFAAVSASLREGLLAEVLEDLEQMQVDLTFPRFEFRTQASLKEALIELGMPVPFEGGRADFSRMSPEGRSLYIQDVIHEAFISVDEEGTEAAAATAVIVGETSAPGEVVQLVVDRPFLFLIRDGETGAILFMGQVTDPAG